MKELDKLALRSVLRIYDANATFTEGLLSEVSAALGARFNEIKQAEIASLRLKRDMNRRYRGICRAAGIPYAK